MRTSPGADRPYGSDVDQHSSAATAPTGTSVATTSPTPAGTATRPVPPRRPHRWGDVAIASVLAAVLSSGGTYAAVRAADDGSPATTTAASTATGGSTSGANAASTADSAAGTTSNARAATLQGSQDWAAIARTVTPSVVSIDTQTQVGQAAGSGVIWDTQGHVVTNAHVVDGAQKVRVTLSDGRAYAAKVVGTDASSDLAVLKLDTVPSGLTPIALGDDRQMAVGDPVMAVGNPLGLSGTVTTGIVSALDRPVTTEGAATSPASQPSLVVTNAIQTSAAINPGNSGGALVDAAGRLIGINSSIASLSQGQGQAGSIGIGFAIPSSKVKLIADQLIATGTAQHAFLGIGLAEGTATVDGAQLSGALVKTVEPSSPAARAGLRAGDVIVGFAGEPTASPEALMGQVRGEGAGSHVTLTYVRDGRKSEAQVTLATRPDEG